ncbi:MAG: hypothetical protein ACO1PI_09315 [Bacteroidota bacterium]
MKHFFLIGILFFTFNKGVTGQTFISMIDTSLIWENSFGYYKNGQQISPWLHYKFSIEDTIFKNDTFRKLLAYTQVDTFVMGGLREDTLERKAYGFYSGDTGVYLMYDWNSQVNDFLYHYEIQFSSNTKIWGIDRKTFVLYDNIDQLLGLVFYDETNINKSCFALDYWCIEGLGSIAGPLNGAALLKIKTLNSNLHPTLSEFEKNKWKIGIKKVRKGTLEYNFNEFSCTNPNVGFDKITKNDVYVAYSPIDKTLTIDTKSTRKISSLEIYTIDGKNVGSEFNLNTNFIRYKINQATLNQTIHILRITLDNSIIIHSKIVLN